MKDRPFPKFSRSTGFLVASSALIGVFFSAGLAIPLYNTFRVEDGITDGDLALTTVAYLGMTALSLLMFGRLSNHLGRRPLVVAALACTIAACLVLMQVHSLPVLITGRVLQGLACGIASTAARDAGIRRSCLGSRRDVARGSHPAVPARQCNGGCRSGRLEQWWNARGVDSRVPKRTRGNARHPIPDFLRRWRSPGPHRGSVVAFPCSGGCCDMLCRSRSPDGRHLSCGQPPCRTSSAACEQ